MRFVCMLTIIRFAPEFSIKYGDVTITDEIISILGFKFSETNTLSGYWYLYTVIIVLMYIE
jgi:hypothetical protein